MLGSFILKAWGIYLYQDLEEKYDKESTGLTWKELEENDKNLVITYGIFYLSFELINILDAINATNEYNEKQQRILNASRPEHNLTLDPETAQLKYTYTWKF